MANNPVAIKTKGKNPVCVSFSAGIDPTTAPPLMGALSNAINNGHDEIHLFLSTQGGSVSDGITLYNFIRALPVPVIIYNVGSVNSIGNVIYQAGTRRVCSPMASFMFHGVGFDISNARLEMKELKERLDSLENDQSLILDIMEKHTSMDRNNIQKLFIEMEFLRAQEALQRGITDEVTDVHLPTGLPILQLVFQR